MDLKTLYYIVVIAEEQNLTRASERLFVSQSTLSLYLRKLEQELGLLLFNRVKNRLEITPAGKLYVETAQQMLDMKKELYDFLDLKPQKQTLNIGISSQMMLKVFVEAFSAYKPLAPDFNVNVTEGRAVALLEKLHNKKLDLAIVGRAKKLQSDEFQVDVIKQEEVWLLLPPDHPCASLASDDYEHPPVVDMGLFVNENFALSPHDTCDYQIAQQLFQDYYMNANVICELNDTKALCQMVLDGLCLSVIPSCCIPRNMGLLVCRPPRPYYRYLLCFKSKKRKWSKQEMDLLGMLYEQYSNYYKTH